MNDSTTPESLPQYQTWRGYFRLRGYNFTVTVSHNPRECLVSYDPTKADLSPDWIASVEFLSKWYPRLAEIVSTMQIAKMLLHDPWAPGRLSNYCDLRNLFLEWDFPNEWLRREIQAVIDSYGNDPLRTAPRRAARPGYVYLIRSETGYYKIGRTTDPDDRILTFSVKLPFEVEYDCLIRSPDHAAMETTLHNRFAHKRVNGEWFALDADDVAYMRELARVTK